MTKNLPLNQPFTVRTCLILYICNTYCCIDGLINCVISFLFQNYYLFKLCFILVEFIFFINLMYYFSNFIFIIFLQFYVSFCHIPYFVIPIIFIKKSWKFDSSRTRQLVYNQKENMLDRTQWLYLYSSPRFHLYHLTSY